MNSLVLLSIFAFLISAGILFILIELRTKHDKTFLYFGFSLLMLCFMTISDLFTHNRNNTAEQNLFWTRMSIVGLVSWAPFVVWYLKAFSHVPFDKVLRLFTFVSILCGFLAFSSIFFRIENGDVLVSPLYGVVFVPYVLLYAVQLFYLNIKPLKRVSKTDRRTLIFHLLGILAVFFSGTLDTILMGLNGMKFSFGPLPNLTSLGALIYGISMTLIFSERFLQIVRERQIAYDKIHENLQQVEQANSLSELGKSTSMINHEINNYMFMISGAAEITLLTEELSDKGKERLTAIFDTSKKLQKFSREILDLSKARIIKEKNMVNLVPMIRICKEEQFVGKDIRIRHQVPESECMIYADWDKLEHAFVNAFKNSFQAGADTVTVDLDTDGMFCFVITITDNGPGCTPEQLEGLFKAFYSTKSNSAGSGLGMSITRSIVESHGGKISAYNAVDPHSGKPAGLQLIMTFPHYKYNPVPGAEDEVKESDIILIKNGITEISSVLKVFSNVSTYPHVFQTIDDLMQSGVNVKGKTILTPAENLKRINGWSKQIAKNQIALLSDEKEHVYILHPREPNRPQVLTEKYVVKRLLKDYWK